MKEFDSEFCNVRYMEQDKAVLLTWKKFACQEDYRRPTSFARELLEEHSGDKLIVDARNGFEDDKEDVEWGFSVLLPGLAQTTCKTVCFIMNEVNEAEADEIEADTIEADEIEADTIEIDAIGVNEIELNAIEEEMDMWTKEFGKYFAIIKASNYRDALEKANRLFLVMVRYHIREGKRDEFFQKVTEQGIVRLSREEPGNYKYDYYSPKDSEDDLCLLELWTNEQAQKQHGTTEHYQKLTILKQEYVESVEIEKYWILKE